MLIDMKDAGKTGVVEWDAPFVRRIVEKPKPEEAPSNISSLPLYIFAPEILRLLPLVQPSPRGEYELQDAIQMLIDRTGQVTGVLTETRQQVTTAGDLLALNKRYLSDTPSQIQCESPLPDNVTLVAPVIIETGVTIGSGSVIGPNVYIEQNAAIGPNAKLEDTMVLRGAEVVGGTHLRGEVVPSPTVLAPTSLAPKLM
jgi:NDP-sugar pyrophosphorylase family protein